MAGIRVYPIINNLDNLAMLAFMLLGNIRPAVEPVVPMKNKYKEEGVGLPRVQDDKTVQFLSPCHPNLLRFVRQRSICLPTSSQEPREDWGYVVTSPFSFWKIGQSDP
jgi:hypothetical protein